MEMQLGTKVWIHAMGSYYAGEVSKVTPTRVQVRYTSGAGNTREKWTTLDPSTGKHVNNKHEAAYPLVAGNEPRPHGARATNAARVRL